MSLFSRDGNDGERDRECVREGAELGVDSGIPGQDTGQEKGPANGFSFGTAFFGTGALASFGMEALAAIKRIPLGSKSGTESLLADGKSPEGGGFCGGGNLSQYTKFRGYQCALEGAGVLWIGVAAALLLLLALLFPRGKSAPSGGSGGGSLFRNDRPTLRTVSLFERAAVLAHLSRSDAILSAASAPLVRTSHSRLVSDMAVFVPFLSR